jgi:S1-C subfamily serine protease
LSGTVSKGIVSALRNFDGLDYIQSDVVTAGGSSGGPLLDDRGNVVGVTVSGFTEGEAPTGLNLFIPIADALRALGVGRVVSAN